MPSVPSSPPWPTMTVADRLCQPTSVHEGSQRAIIAAFLANLGIAVMKFVGWIVTSRPASWPRPCTRWPTPATRRCCCSAAARGQRKATPDHPFGYGRERYFWSFIVALVLFLLGGAFAIYEGIQKLRHPHEPESLWWAVGILRRRHDPRGLLLPDGGEGGQPRAGQGSGGCAFLRRSKSPELPVVLLEDSGALVGLVLRPVRRGDGQDHRQRSMGRARARWPSASCCASSPSSWPVEMKGLLIGESASPDMERAASSTP